MKRKHFRGSELAQTVYSAVPHRQHAVPDGSRQQSEAERFFFRSFGHCDFPLALYDTNQDAVVLGPNGSEFPARLKPHQNRAAGCGFVMGQGRLFFTLDVPERWPHAPTDVAYVAAQVKVGHLPAIDVATSIGSLTNSEFELLGYLLEGLDLKAAAQAVGANYDTKRKQIQRILEKLGFKSQMAMLRSISVSLTAHLIEELLSQLPSDAEAALARKHYGQSLIVTRISIGQGLEVPVWDIGDRNGTPVVYFHSMLTPVIFSDSLPAILREHNLRMLMVPRHFVDVNEIPDSDARQRHIVDGIAAALSYLTSAPLICLGDSAGCSWAVRFTHSHPEMVAELHLSATPQSGANLQSPTLFSDVSSRIKSSEQVLYGLTRIYNTIARSPVFSRRALSYMYRSSPSDLATLEQAFSDLHLSDWLTLIANRALHSSLDEVVSLQRDWIKDISDIEVPVTFWHGTEDPICPIEEIERLVTDLEDANFKIVKGAGHFLISQKLDDLASAFSTRKWAQ